MKLFQKTTARLAAIGVAILGFRLLPVRAYGLLQQVKDFTIYYGEPTEQNLTQLMKKDLVIIEPQLYSKEQIAGIRSAGSSVIGYLSVMESPTWNQQRLQQLLPEDYLLQQGERVHFQQWDSYLMDLRRPHYRELLLQEIGASITDKGLNGVFLDTIGDMDDHIKDIAVQTQIRQAYRVFLQDLTKRFPKLLLIQNRGFDSLDYATPYIHGILWEDWQGAWKQDPWIKIRVERLQKEQKKGLKIFSVSSGSDRSNGKESNKLKFVHTDIPGGYNSMERK
jgi:hypothetical protein